jgi:hypothetical protein
MLGTLKGCLVSSLMAISGCNALEHPGGPPPAFDVDQDIQDLEEHYRSVASIKTYYAAGPESKARRDEFVVGRLSLYNLEYIKFVQQFYLSSAQINSIIDITNIGLGLAATLVEPAVTKSILAAIATGLTGTRLSIERNFFQQRTIEVLVTQMNAQRTAALVPIQQGLTRSVEQYPLALAIVDLNAYYEAGTIQGAITGIQVSAGQLQATAEQELARLRDIKSEPDQSSAILKRWLFPGFATEDASGRFLDVSGKPAAADPTRLTQLRDWLKRNGLDVPIAVLLRASELASTRTKIISDLKVHPDQTGALPNPELTRREVVRPPVALHVGAPTPNTTRVTARDQSGVILGRWLFPSSVSRNAQGEFVEVSGKRAAADSDRLAQLRTWMTQNSLSIPIVVLLRSPNNAGDRRKAISDLKIQSDQTGALANPESVGGPNTTGVTERDQSGMILGRWLFPSSVSENAQGAFADVSGKPAPADSDRLAQLRAWMTQNSLHIPIVVFLRSPNNAGDRRKAISTSNFSRGEDPCHAEYSR